MKQGPGSPGIFLTYLLQEAFPVSVSLYAGSDGVLREDLALAYTRLRLDYDDGEGSTSVHWDMPAPAN